MTLPFTNIEDIIQHVDPRGRWQIWTTVKAAMATLGMSVIGYSQSLFFVGKMQHECVLFETDAAGILNGDAKVNLSFTSNNSTNTERDMSSACVSPSGARCLRWKYSSLYYDSTMVSEYDMVCDRAYLLPTFQAAVVIGQIIGNAVSGVVSDRFGRRWSVEIGYFGTLVVALAMSFVKPLWLNIILRMLVGVFTTAVWNALFVTCMELAVPERRNAIGVYVSITWALGAALSALLAYFIQSWRQLALVSLAIATVVGSPFVLAIPESPRWLVLHKKFSQARKQFENNAAPNSLPPGDEFLEIIYRRHVERVQNSQNNDVSFLRQIIRLLSERRLRVRSLMLATDWVVVAFVYFGILYYGSGALPGSPMLLLGIMSIGRACANPLYVVFFNLIGCRNTLMCALAVICVSMLTLGLVPLQHHPVTAILYAVLYVLAYVASDLCFAAIYIVTGELYPTVLRQTSLGFFSLVARAGSLSSPYVAALVAQIWLPLPALVFGGTCAVATVAALMLPRADDAALPDTVEDAKELDDFTEIDRQHQRSHSLMLGREQQLGNVVNKK